MGLIVNVFIIAVVVIVLLVATQIFLGGPHSKVNAAEAIANVTSYIRTSYSSAVVNVTSVNASQTPGSWQIVASIIVNSTKPCPSYFIASFDYPQYGFVSRTVNNYTSNCHIAGLQQNLPYNISSAPEAIAMSFNSTVNIPKIKEFVSMYGYKNVNVSARYTNFTMVNGVAFSNVWVVNYTAAGHWVSVLLNRTVILDKLNGMALPVYNSS